METQFSIIAKLVAKQKNLCFTDSVKQA